MNKAKEEKISKRKTLSNKEIKKKRLQEQGITLIALVITIIILLILAGVTLNAAIGENGLFQRAKLATEKYQEAEDDEQRKMTMYEAVMNTKSTEYEDKKGKKVTIPAGFAVSQVEGENTIDGGLVIIDTKGNEFVWIEVPKSEQIYTKTTTSVTSFDEAFYKNIEEDLIKYVEDYREYRYNLAKGTNVDTSDTWKEGCKLDGNKYNALKKSMLKSIYVNGGFWIGRYEVGYEGEVRYKPDNNWSEEVNVTPVVKEGAYPLNYICYPQAQKLSNNITYGEYEGSLMFGIQFDLVCKFIEEKHGKNKNEITENSISWGNYRNAIFDINKGKYSEDMGQTFEKVFGTYNKGPYDTGEGVLLTTGATDRNSVLNIYDFAGNLNEFSLELFRLNEAGYSILRGGTFKQSGDAWKPIYGGDTNYGACYNDVGFRITLIPLND